MTDEHTPSAIVQEADSAERVVVLKIRVPGRTAFVIVGAARNGGGAGLLPQGARQELWAGKLPPGSARQRGREDALEKARLLAITDSDVLFEPWAARRENPANTDAVAAADAGPGWPGLVRSLRVHAGRVVVTDVTLAPGTPAFIDVFEADRVALEARGLAIARALAEDAIEIHRGELVRALEKARTRIDRRRAAVREDLAKIAQADRIAAQAQWLVGEATRAPRGATKLVVTDWSSGEAVPMEVPLDPSKSAREQVEAMFRRAKRLKLGGRIAGERLAQADGHASAVEAAIVAVRAAETVVAMEAAAREAKRIAPRDVALPGPAGASTRAPTSTSAHPSAKGRRIAFRTFTARSGRKILVGKGAADNDTLTLKIAKPNDLWLHAKDRTGAHVLVPLEKNHTCPAEDLVDAAHLAAHFSDAREEKAVDVQYTPKRYLRKPKGSAVGAVIVDREKVLALRFDAALLKQLLEREEI
ncbi:MAG TPA: NFACT RNA binding domain-containing protein [Labilithrix sp.]|nr:NFACT RNA binding domain-containing protein [Labilithrix sp.]